MHWEIINAFRSAGFGDDPTQWHIYRHDIYGTCFCNTWKHMCYKIQWGDFNVYREEHGNKDTIEERTAMVFNSLLK